MATNADIMNQTNAIRRELCLSQFYNEERLEFLGKLFLESGAKDYTIIPNTGIQLEFDNLPDNVLSLYGDGIIYDTLLKFYSHYYTDLAIILNHKPCDLSHLSMFYYMNRYNKTTHQLSFV